MVLYVLRMLVHCADAFVFVSFPGMTNSIIEILEAGMQLPDGQVTLHTYVWQ